MASDDATKPKEKSIEEERLVFECKLLESQMKEARRKYDWEWVVRTLYVRGYHFARYNREANTVIFSPKAGVRIPINLVNAHLRGVRNQVTSFQPKWEVLPIVTTKDAFENARYSGKVLDSIYKTAQVKRKIKEVVNDCLIYSIGVWHFDTNDKGDVVVNRVDPFDFYVDQNVKSANLNDPEYGAEHVLLTHQVPIDALKKNRKFTNTEHLNTDNLTANAEYKRFLLQAIRVQTTSSSEVNKTIILKQMYRRERDEGGVIRIRLISYVDGSMKPLSNELLETDQYPFEILQGDIAGGELYGEAWLKHLIPINRVIDALESHRFEYNHLFAKGRFIIDKNSGVKLITNQHGQIIEKNRGSTVQAITVPPLPPSPQEQINDMRRYLEDISGVHDVSLGRMPGSLRSGTAIAELKQADATNQADIVDNLEDFLARSGQKILRSAAENWSTTKLMSVTGLGGKPEYFMAVGEKAQVKKKGKFKSGDQELPLAVIGMENEVRVQVGSWLAYTKEARQEKLKEMYRLGAIDQQTFLQHAEFADIDGIMERTREEQIMQAAAGSRSQAMEKEFGVQLDDESIAIAENELMVEESTPQPVYANDDHQIHLMIHKDQQENGLVQQHVAEHMKYMKWKQKMTTMPLSQNGPPNPGQQEVIDAGQQAQAMEGGMPPPQQQLTNPSIPSVGPAATPFNPSQDLIVGGR